MSDDLLVVVVPRHHGDDEVLTLLEGLAREIPRRGTRRVLLDLRATFGVARPLSPKVFSTLMEAVELIKESLEDLIIVVDRDDGMAQKIIRGAFALLPTPFAIHFTADMAEAERLFGVPLQELLPTAAGSASA